MSPRPDKAAVLAAYDAGEVVANILARFNLCRHTLYRWLDQRDPKRQYRKCGRKSKVAA